MKSETSSAAGRQARASAAMARFTAKVVHLAPVVGLVLVVALGGVLRGVAVFGRYALGVATAAHTPVFWGFAAGMIVLFTILTTLSVLLFATLTLASRGPGDHPGGLDVVTIALSAAVATTSSAGQWDYFGVAVGGLALWSLLARRPAVAARLPAAGCLTVVLCIAVAGAVTGHVLLPDLPPQAASVAPPPTGESLHVTPPLELGLHTIPRVIGLIAAALGTALAASRSVMVILVGRRVGMNSRSFVRELAGPAGLAAVGLLPLADRGLAAAAGASAFVTTVALTARVIPGLARVAWLPPLFRAMLAMPLVFVANIVLIFGVAVVTRADYELWRLARAAVIVGAFAGGWGGVGLSIFAARNERPSLARQASSVFRTLGTRPWLDDLAAAARSGPPPEPRAFLAVERMVNAVVWHRDSHPLARQPLPDGFEEPPAGLLATLRSSPAHVVVLAARSAAGDHLAQAEAADATAEHVELRRLAWLIDENVCVDAARRWPLRTLGELSRLIGDSTQGPLALRWMWLRIRALAEVGAIGPFLESTRSMAAQVGTGSLDDILGVSGVWDQMLAGGSRSDSKGAPVTLRSSALRIELVGRLLAQIDALVELARLGGDPEVIETLSLESRRVRRIAADLRADAPATALATSERRDRWSDLLHCSEGNPGGVESGELRALAERIFSTLGTWTYAPVLAGLRCEPSALTWCLCLRWSPERGDSGASEAGLFDLWRLAVDGASRSNEDHVQRVRVFVGEDLRGSGALGQLMMERSGLSQSIVGRAVRGAWRRWGTPRGVGAHLLDVRARGEEPFALLRAAANVAAALGCHDEARRLAAEMGTLASILGDHEQQLRSSLLLSQLTGEPLPRAEGNSLQSRLVRALSRQRALAASSTIGEWVDELEGRRIEDWTTIFPPGVVYVLQVLTPDGLSTMVVSDKAGVEHFHDPCAAGTILADVAALRAGLEARMPIGAWKPLALRLSEALLRHVEVGSVPLVYAGIGSLGRVPMSVLPHGGAMLGLARPWSRADRPSRCPAPGKHVAEARSALYFGSGEVPLPMAEAECRSLLGFEVHEARAAALRQALRPRASLHLACHGRAGRFDAADCALEFSDGDVDPDMLHALPATGAAVYLSACDTAVGSLIPGEYGGGLTGAILGAGASFVVGTQWMMDDAVAARAAGAFWDAIGRGECPASALYCARREVSDAPAHTWGALELHHGTPAVTAAG